MERWQKTTEWTASGRRMVEWAKNTSINRSWGGEMGEKVTVNDESRHWAVVSDGSTDNQLIAQWQADGGSSRWAAWWAEDDGGGKMAHPA